jgi:hypothetical protein
MPGLNWPDQQSAASFRQFFSSRETCDFLDCSEAVWQNMGDLVLRRPGKMKATPAMTPGITKRPSTFDDLLK